jgi:hypothetical protein
MSAFYTMDITIYLCDHHAGEYRAIVKQADIVKEQMIDAWLNRRVK